MQARIGGGVDQSGWTGELWGSSKHRDAFLGLMKTCAKQAISFWDYLGDRLGVPGAPAVPSLAELIRADSPA